MFRSYDACSNPGFNAEAAPVNVTLKNLIQALFPAQYAARLAEAVAERRDWDAKVPLFCMAGTFFPGQVSELKLLVFLVLLLCAAGPLPPSVDVMAHAPPLLLLAHIAAGCSVTASSACDLFFCSAPCSPSTCTSSSRATAS